MKWAVQPSMIAAALALIVEGCAPAPAATPTTAPGTTNLAEVLW